MTPLLVGAAVLFVVWQLRPGLLFANTTPTGQDLGGHVWAPAYLRSHLLPHLSGWSPEMFGGVPAYVLYPVLPAVIVAILNTVVPYGVALKLVVALGIVALPVAAWLLGRLARLARPLPALFAVATLPFLFDSSYHAAGGNLNSDVSGEFSYGLGLICLVVAIALVDRLCRTGRGRALAAVAVAACFLCHPVTGLMLALAVLVVVGVHLWLGGGMEVVRRIVPVAVVSGALSACWLLPFVWYRHELTSTVNPRQTNWATLFFPMPPLVELVVVALALTGIVVAISRREPLGLILTGLLVLAMLGVFALPQGVLVNIRVDPIWHLARYLLAAYGASELLQRLTRIRPWAELAGSVGALVVIVFVIGVSMGSLPGTTVARQQTANGAVQTSSWLFLPKVHTNIDSVLVSYGFGGYERYFHHDEYQALVHTMGDLGARLGCGRAFDEFDPTARYGSIYSLSILGYWTNGCIDGMTGVAPDQSRNTPFIEAAQQRLSTYVDLPTGQARTLSLDVGQGVAMLRDLGVRYYLAWSPNAQSQAAGVGGLTQVATSGQWKIYTVAASAPVEALTRQPVIAKNASSESAWNEAAQAWMSSDHTGPIPAAGGPASWRGTPTSAALPVTTVSAVESRAGRISFHVDRTGVPVVIRESYFPWWRATGASGPWHVAPDNMVVIPTRNDVVLTAAPRGADHLALWLSGVGMLGLLGLVGLDVGWIRRLRQPAEGSEASTAAIGA